MVVKLLACHNLIIYVMNSLIVSGYFVGKLLRVSFCLSKFGPVRVLNALSLCASWGNNISAVKYALG